MSQIVDHNPNDTGRTVTNYRYDSNGNPALEIKEQAIPELRLESNSASCGGSQDLAR